jgi:hypothetical protein
MHGQWRWFGLCALLLVAAVQIKLPAALAVSVDTVTVSPSVVPVPVNPTQKTALLISAAVSGVPAGTTVSCTVSLVLISSNAVLAVSPAVNTSPAPASGATSMTVQMLLSGSTPLGRAQATATCGASSGSAPFRVTSPVALVVAPAAVPAGGSTNVTVTIAGGVALPPTPCALIVTDPSGASPPLATQTVTVSGGSGTVPASTTVSLTPPPTAPLGLANASISCVVTGSGTAGDSTDFTVTDPSVVTVLPLPIAVDAGSTLTVTAVTLPGFVCVALLTPAAGARIPSGAATAGPTGSATPVVVLPAAVELGTVSLSVTCADPVNPANTANSALLTTSIVAAGTAAGIVAGGTATASVTPAISTTAGCTGLGGGAAPVPMAAAGGLYAGRAGDRLQFSGAGSLPSTMAVLTTCVWSFGDGGRATTLAPTHTYAAAGVYSVTLTVTDSAGLSATATTTANIASYVPLCSQPGLTGNEGLAPCVVGGVCASTAVPAQCPSGCQTYAPAVLCPQPGIVVQASAGGPYSGQVSQPLAFQGAATAIGTRRVCAADASLGTAGPVCNLVPAVDLPTAVTYLWDFGDGDAGNGAGPTHSYASPASYRITLTVAFDDGSVAVGSTTALISGPSTSGP